MQLRNGKVMNKIQRIQSDNKQNSENIITEIIESDIKTKQDIKPKQDTKIETNILDKQTFQIFKNIIIGRVSEINKVIDKFNEKHDKYKTEQYDIFLENTVKYAKRAVKSLIYLFEFVDKFSYSFLEDVEECYPVFIQNLRSMFSDHYTHSKTFTIYYKSEGFSNKKYKKMMNLLISILGKLGPNIKNIPVS
jgi:hypothetical protein